MTKFITEPLHAKHKKSEFSSGNAFLDNYLHKQAKQDIKRKLSACFILSTPEGEVKGYYTLSNAGIPRKIIPQKISKKLPKAYSSLPVTLLGRLAIDNRHKGQALGKLILIDALKRSFQVAKIIGSIAVIVDPIDKNAQEFYTKYGFTHLPDSGKMFLAMKTIEILFKH